MLSNKLDFITVVKGDYGRGGRGGRGGHGGHQIQGKPPGSFNFRFDRINVPRKELEPITYSFVVIGHPADVARAIAGIDNSLSKYKIE